ncbi:MAG: phage tail protein [Peptococcaceae bacterium]|nr:phage tail protein [Peptococcaceae bacterium]MDH7525297.1 phage tail protein [Peptococcaceae bacterium]
MDLKDIDLLKLQTLAMQNDKTTQALCAVLTPQLQQVANEIDKCVLLARVDNLSEEILDELAYELHIDWYDASASVEVKRALIKNSDKVHMYLGTPYAVNQVVRDYFGDGYMEAWYEYGSTYPHFRVITSNLAVMGEEAERFANAVEKVKQGVARLEAVVILMSAEFPFYSGFAIQIGDYLIIEQVV